MTYVAPWFGEVNRRTKNVLLPLLGFTTILEGFSMPLVFEEEWDPLHSGYQKELTAFFGWDNPLPEIPKIIGASAYLGTQFIQHPMYSSANKTLRAAWDNGELATTGLYKVTANPIYLADRLFALGAFLFAPTITVSALSGLIFLNTHFAAAGESTRMEQKHGEEYRSYKASTMLPF